MCFRICYVWVYVLEEGDGRCVRASWPDSAERSILGLLLNPPLVFCFIKTFVGCPCVENVAHCFPPHELHLDLTFLC